jgi:hypothetical protein
MNLVEPPEDASPYDKVWENCDADLAAHSRDAIELLFIGLADSLFTGSFRVRALYSWIPSVIICVAYSSLLSYPAFRLNDGGGTVILFGLLGFAQCGNWVSCTMNERENRENWALNRIREEDSCWQKDFVDVNFPIVVRVRNGRLEPRSALEPHFGSQVSGLDDLPCVRDSGAYDYGVEKLVNEVVATGKAAKRNVLLKPVGGSMSFKCAVCASPELDEEGTILGFEIFESYDASADTRGMDDPGPSPSAVGVESPSPSAIGGETSPSLADARAFAL